MFQQRRGIFTAEKATFAERSASPSDQAERSTFASQASGNNFASQNEGLTFTSQAVSPLVDVKQHSLEIEPRKDGVITKGSQSITIGRAELVDDNIIIKGSADGSVPELTISTKSIKEVLRKLKPHQAVLIKNLSGQPLEDFNTIKNVVGLMFKSGAEQMIHNPIVEVFGDVDKVIPGTVAAYMIGCRVRTDHKGNPACAPICAGSSQLDSSIPGHQVCETLAVLYNKDGSFTQLNTPSSKKDAYIYVADDTTPAFSAAEIDLLRSYGIERSKIIQYSSDGKQHKEITPEFVTLSLLPRRDVPAPRALQRELPVVVPPPKTTSGSTIIIILLIVLVVLALLFIYSQRGKMMQGLPDMLYR